MPSQTILKEKCEIVVYHCESRKSMRETDKIIRHLHITEWYKNDKNKNGQGKKIITNMAKSRW